MHEYEHEISDGCNLYKNRCYFTLSLMYVKRAETIKMCTLKDW